MQLTGLVLKKLAWIIKAVLLVFNLHEPGNTTVSQAESRIFYRGEADRNNQSPAKCEAPIIQVHMTNDHQIFSKLLISTFLMVVFPGD